MPAQRFYHAANAAAFVHPPGSSRRAVCGPYRRAWGGNSFDARLSRLWSKKFDLFVAGLLPGDHGAYPPKEGWRAYLPAFAQVCVLAGVGVFMIFFTSAPLRTVFWVLRRSFAHPDFILLSCAAQRNAGRYFLRSSGRPHGQRLFRVVDFLFAGRSARCADTAIARAGRAADLHCAGVLSHNTGGAVFTASLAARFI